MSRDSSLVLVYGDSASTSSEVTYSWYGHTDFPNKLSLLNLVEENDECLRNRYLTWISGVGESLHKGKSLTEWTALTDSFSYWWMTLIAERSVWKTPAITDALRLLAIEEVIATKPPNHLVLLSRDPLIRSAIQQLCECYQVPFQWNRPTQEKRPDQMRSGKHRPIHPILATLAMYARYTYRWWKFRSVVPEDFIGNKNPVLFATRTQFSHQPGYDTQRPYSNSWSNLPILLDDEGIPSNWLEMHTWNSRTPLQPYRVQQLRHCDKQSSLSQVHTVLDSFLSARVLLRVSATYLRLVAIYLRLRPRRIRDNLANRPWLWHLHADAWKSSMVGCLAVENLIWFVLFDKALGCVAPQRRGFYLAEGQSWEAAFINAWYRHGLGELIAVPHSTVRFWDFRIFPDIGTSSEHSTYSRPAPDFVAVNGPLARSVLNGPGVPPRQTVECEALRYQHLDCANRWTSTKRSSDQPLRILLVADYLQDPNEAMIGLVREAVPLIQPGTQFTIKPQPNGKLSESLLKQLHVDVREEALSQLINDHDIALVSSGTSAVVDLYILGIPVVVFQYEDSLNFNPLKGFAELPTVGTATELVQALEDAANTTRPPIQAGDLLFLDPTLQRWMALVGMPSGT